MNLEAQLICSIQKTARANPQYLKFEMAILQKDPQFLLFKFYFKSYLFGWL